MSAIAYSSSNPAIAEVSADGTVTAKLRGTSVITASYSNYDGSVVTQKLIVNVYNKNKSESFETNASAVNTVAYDGIVSLSVKGNVSLISSEEINYAEVNFYDSGDADAAVSFGGVSVLVGDTYSAGSESITSSDGWHQIVFDNRGEKMAVFVDGEKLTEAVFTGAGVISASGSGIYVDNANISDITGSVCIANNVAIRGSNKAGETLNASYGYSDADNDKEQGTVITWYRSNSENGNYTKCGEGAAYKTGTADNYVKVGVTPKNIYDAGAEVLSPAFKVNAKGDSYGGGGGAGGGGGSSTGGAVSSQTVVSISTKEEQKQQQKYFDFADVPTTHWGYEAIMTMRKREIINGVGENIFNPDGLVTKAEFAAMVIRALGSEIKAYSGSFTDVKSGDWYADTVETAYSSGLISGYDGKFNPNDNISREQMVKIIVEAYKTLNPEYELSNKAPAFADIETAGEWSRAYIASASELGFVSGGGENMFEPLGVATRAQAAVIINNMLED